MAKSLPSVVIFPSYEVIAAAMLQFVRAFSTQAEWMGVRIPDVTDLSH